MTKTYWSADLVPTFNLLIPLVIDRKRHGAYHQRLIDVRFRWSQRPLSDSEYVSFGSIVLVR